MNLSFMTVWPKTMPGKKQGVKNYFIEKLFAGFNHFNLWDFETFNKYADLLVEKEKLDIEYLDNMFGDEDKGKIHTIRRDEKGRWEVGNLIHFVINNRTANRLQILPIIKVVAIQEIEIIYGNLKAGWDRGVKIDGRFLMDKELKDLAVNDGFASLNEFFDYFNKDFKGKLIHWTNTKY